MDAKQMAERFPELGTEQEIGATLQRLASIPKLNLYQQKIACTPSGFGREAADQGHILIQSVSDDNVVGPPIAAIDLDAESCDALLKALFNMRRQFKVLAEYKASKRQ